jgi:hypothetical protein
MRHGCWSAAGQLSGLVWHVRFDMFALIPEMFRGPLDASIFALDANYS